MCCLALVQYSCHYRTHCLLCLGLLCLSPCPPVYCSYLSQLTVMTSRTPFYCYLLCDVSKSSLGWWQVLLCIYIHVYTCTPVMSTAFSNLAFKFVSMAEMDSYSQYVGKILRKTCKAICFALSVRLCAHIGQAVSKCSVQELQTNSRRLQVATLLACFEAGGTASVLTQLSHRTPTSLPDDLNTMCECVLCYRWLQSLIWHLYCLSLWTTVMARRSTCAALRDMDCPPQPPPALLTSVSLPSAQWLLPKRFLA